MKARPWTVEDNLVLVEMFKNRATQRAMAVRLKRSKSACALQLKKLGLTAVSEVDKEWRSLWFDDYAPAKSVGKRIYISCR